MNTTNHGGQNAHLVDALAAADPSVRLRAALAVGTRPDPELTDALIDRCAVEPDFFVRDMLTWALCRLPAEITVPRLIRELGSDGSQARSQALHTLSKIGDPIAWPEVSALVHDQDDEVARSAWRAAVALVPAGVEGAFAADLATELGRGELQMQLSLSRALTGLGEAVLPVLDAAGMSRIRVSGRMLMLQSNSGTTPTVGSHSHTSWRSASRQSARTRRKGRRMLIGEVSRRCGVSTRMLRHYDTLGLVKPTGRTSGGYREYSADDIRRLFHVESLRTLGLSLNEAKRALDEPDFAPADLVGELMQHTRQRIAAEEELLTKLERVDASAPSEWDDVLRMVSLLRALESEFAAHRQQAILSQELNAALPVDALVEAILSEKDANVAGALQWALARTEGAGLAGLTKGLESEDVEVRRRATSAISGIHTEEATRALKRALDDSDVIVRADAALTLGSRGEAVSMPALLEMVADGRRDVEAGEVLGLLAEHSPTSGEVVDAVQARLDGTDDAPTRLRITQALAEIPGAAAREALARLTRDNDKTVASTAAAILEMRDRGPRRRERPRIGN